MTASLQSLLSSRPEVRLVVPQAYESSGFPAPTTEASQEDAEVVEGDGSFAIRPVAPAEHSGFTHFLDGSQKSWLVAYWNLYPVYFSHLSAAVIPRVDRQLVPNGADYQVRRRFFGADFSDCPEFSEVDPSIGIEAVGGHDDAPDTVAEKITTAISNQRALLEDSLAKAYQDNGVLLVDGGLGNSLAEPFGPLVGMVKSHRRQYFASPERARLILGMRPGDRTSVFLRPGGKKERVNPYSFYLKLFENQNEGPMYGLVRIELPPVQDWLERADEVASWVLAERVPSSRPDPRHDRMLYPIRMVEEYLKAQQPSEAWVRGMLGK